MSHAVGRSALGARFATRPYRELLVWLVVAFAPFYLSAVANDLLGSPAETTSYDALVLPWFAPPGWAFVVAWTINFGLAGVGAWLVSRSDAPRAAGRLAFAAFAAQVTLGFASTLVATAPDAPGPYYAVLALLLAAAVANGLANARVDRRAGLALVPYVAWVAYAGVVFVSVVRLN